MDRTEFLAIMRESLERKIPQAEIEDTIRYYREYFEQSDLSDEELCEELGNPNAIAQSVVKAYLASKGSAAEQYTREARQEYSQMYGSTSYEQETQDSSAGRIMRQVILILVIVGVIIILGLLLRMAFAILLPVLLIYMLWKLIRRDW